MLSNKNKAPEKIRKSTKKQNGNILKLIQATGLVIGLLLSNGGFAKAENSGLKTENETISEENYKKIQDIKNKLDLIKSINLTERQEAIIRDAILRHEINKELGNIPDFYKIELKKIQIKSLSDYSQILDTSEYISDFQVNEMNINNFVNIIDSLFDISSPYKIIKSDNGEELTDEEMMLYKQQLLIQSVYIKKTILSYDDNIKLKFLDEWFRLFNDGVKKSISKSRAVQRLIAFSSFNILMNKYPTQEMKQAKKEEIIDIYNYLASLAGRYEIMTSKGEISGIQISVEIAGIKTYFLIVGGDSLKKYGIDGEKYLKIISAYIYGIDNNMLEMKKLFQKKSKGIEA